MVGRTEKPGQMFVEDGKTVARYLKEIAGNRILTAEEERQLLSDFRPGDKKALKILVEANLKFVVAVCFNYANRGLPMGDLINEGNLGLIRAANHFKPAMNVRFISYAVWWIRQGIVNALAMQGQILSVSANTTKVKQNLRKEEGRLMQRLGRQPTLEELAETSGCTPEVVSRALALGGKPRSLDGPVPYEVEMKPAGPWEDALIPNPDESLSNAQIQEGIEKVLDSLGARESKILKLYYGIGSGIALSLAEIANRFGLSRERVRQIREKSLIRLRKTFRKDGLKELDG